MRRAYIVTLICLLITVALAGNFAANYEPGNIATAQFSLPVEQQASTQVQLSLETTEMANLIGIGVIFGAVIFVTILAFYRKPSAIEEEEQI